jgi:PAS domain S-box-containing protein
MMRGIGKGITLKWMVFSILLATIPLAIAVGNIYKVYQKDIKESVIQIQKEKASMVMERTKGFLEKATSNLLLIASDENFRKTGSSQTKDHLKNFLSQKDYFIELAFLNEKGLEMIKVLKFKTEGTSDQKDQSVSQMFQVASKGQIFYGNFYYTSDGKQTMVIAIPVEKYKGRPVGVLKARVYLEPLTDLLHQTKIGKTGSAYVIDKEGYLVAHPNEKNILIGPFVDQVIAGQEGSLEFENIRGQKYLVVYKPIPELNWGVVVQVPVEEAYKPLKEIAQTAVKWIIIASILAFGFSLFLTRRLTSPIKQLSNEMAKVSKGNLDAHIEPTTKDEIGILTESFNQMIQDLKHSQESIKEAEGKYQMIFENSKDMIYITSAYGTWIDVNRAGVEMFGYTNREELMKIPVKDTYFDPEERKRFQSEIARGEFVKDFDVRLKRKDGTPIDCLITASARKDASGEILGYGGIIKNISERKRMERELLNRKEELQTLYDLSTLINQTLDLDQILPMTLERVLTLTGFEMGTIYLVSDDREWLELRYYKNYPSHLAEAVKKLKRGEGVVGSAVDKKKIITFSIDQYPSPRILPNLIEEKVKTLVGIPLLSKGEAIGAICLTSRSDRLLGQNDTHLFESLGNQIGMTVENARLLEEIKGSEEKYRTVVEGVHDGVAVIGADFKFKFVNRRLEEILGYAQDELVGMDFRNVLAEESKASVTDRYIKWAKKEEMTPVMEFSFLRKNKEIRHMEISNKEIRGPGGHLSFVALMKDITEKKKIEEQLIQNEKLRSLGEMASGVAHDFNNALAAILGNTQLLLYTAQDEETREALKTIEKVTKDSAQTVKRLQEFTRKRARQELFKLDVNSIVKDAVEITKPKWRNDAQGKGIHIEVLSSLGEVPSVVGDASELREVITNLIFNAVEAMPQGGTMEFRTFRKGGDVHIRISDTGIGMDEETRKKIFEPFFTTKPFSNTGLGLSMSYGIIKRFNGEIKIESKVGSGTAFSIVLPVAIEGKEAVAPHAMIKPVKPARILVIDDEATVREVLEKMLSQVDHRVTAAQNGDEGIRLFQEKEFDIVLTDLGMPGMSGWEVCQKIKKMNPYTPVGMITGWGMEVSQSKMEECGLDFIIAKPFDFNQIIRVVSEKIEPRT